MEWEGGPTQTFSRPARCGAADILIWNRPAFSLGGENLLIFCHELVQWHCELWSIRQVFNLGVIPSPIVFIQCKRPILEVHYWNVMFIVCDLIDVETPTSFLRPLVTDQVRDCDTDSVSVITPAGLRFVDCIRQLCEHLITRPVSVQEEGILPLTEPEVSAVTHASPQPSVASIPPLLDGRYPLSNRRDSIVRRAPLIRHYLRRKRH